MANLEIEIKNLQDAILACITRFEKDPSIGRGTEVDNIYLQETRSGAGKTKEILISVKIRD